MKQLVQHIIIMNGRFQFGHAMRLAGPSQCGKTSTLCKLLASKEFFDPHPPKRVMWVSGTRDEKLEREILQNYPKSQFLYELPQDLNEMVQERDFWVFDDLSAELQKNSAFTNFFTKGCHHNNCMLAYLTQNAYEHGKDSTTRTRNCAYQIYFRNKADIRWIRVLGQQLTGCSKKFEAIFNEATKQPFSCLLCDNRVTTPANEQFIGNAFSSEPTYFLVPHK